KEKRGGAMDMVARLPKPHNQVIRNMMEREVAKQTKQQMKRKPQPPIYHPVRIISSQPPISERTRVAGSQAPLRASGVNRSSDNVASVNIDETVLDFGGPDELFVTYGMDMIFNVDDLDFCFAEPGNVVLV